MNKNDLIVPIRTRGAIRNREEHGEAVPSAAPIRTRGAIRTRGISPEKIAAPPKELITIPALIDRLRDESVALPLSTVAYGWGSRQTVEFVSKLRPYLWQEDALVLLPSKQEDVTAVPVPGGGVAEHQPPLP